MYELLYNKAIEDNADIAEQLRLLNQKITNYYFVENDKQSK